jgi:hypothetical protein
MRKFVDLTVTEKEQVIRAWRFKENPQNIYVNEHLVPFTKHEKCFVNCGVVRADVLICGGFHNKAMRKNPDNRVNIVL